MSNDLSRLYDAAFARHSRGKLMRQRFADSWASYVASHPWDVAVRHIDASTLEILAVIREPAPLELALDFSEWLANLRAALDNGLYALAAATSGQDPPPMADRIQFPICSTPHQFQAQLRRLAMLPGHIIEALEKGQPYHSPFGLESNLTYWVNELARKDRHRSLHIGLGRVDEHRIRVTLPPDVTIQWDESVNPYSHINDEMVVGRFTASRPLRLSEVVVDLRGVTIAPEIEAWSGFVLDGRSRSLHDRMTYTELFFLNHLENLALMGNFRPQGGFKTFDPDAP